MKFLIQTVDNKVRSVEEFNLQRLIDESFSYKSHSYILTENADIENAEDYIPVGDLGFVEQHLKKYHNITKINPIEIPKCMRNKYYVNRYYKIFRKESIPEREFSFVKDVSKLKVYTGLMSLSESNKKFLSGETYQISEYTPFISEYRVFVLRGTIQAIQHYKEDVTIFPDINVIMDIINDYMEIQGHSRAFTIDVGVDKKNRTQLIEIHTFVSCGTYGYVDESLFEMYRQGYLYILENNLELNIDTEE